MTKRVPTGVEFHDRIATEWTSAYSRGSFKKRLACFSEVFGRVVRPGQSWLDLGCGSGVLTRQLIQAGATRVVGVDGSSAMLEQAAHSLELPPGVQVNWVESDVQAVTGFPANSFDGVLCSSVIEYVENPGAVLKEIARVLHPGGVFLVSVPPKGALIRTVQKIFRRVGQACGKEVFDYLTVSRFEVDPTTMRKQFLDAGLLILLVTKFDPMMPGFLTSMLRPSLLVVEGRKESE